MLNHWGTVAEWSKTTENLKIPGLKNQSGTITTSGPMDPDFLGQWFRL